jgi:hypothetical protein
MIVVGEGGWCDADAPLVGGNAIGTRAAGENHLAGCAKASRRSDECLELRAPRLEGLAIQTRAQAQSISTHFEKQQLVVRLLVEFEDGVQPIGERP